MKKYAVSAITTLVLLVLLIGGGVVVGFDAIMAPIASMRVEFLAATIGIILLNNLVRARRFAVVLPRLEKRVIRIWLIVNVHQFMTQMLPLRTGEVSFVLLARRQGLAQVEQATCALLLVRFTDLALLGVIVGFALNRQGYLGPTLPAAIGWPALALISYLSTAALPMLGRRLTGWISSLLRAGSPGQRRCRLVAALDRIVGGFDLRLGWRRLAELTLLSLIQHAGVFAGMWVILRSVGTHLSAMPVILGACGPIITGILPINTVGSIGSLHAGWVAGFSAVGVPVPTALSTAILYHAVYTIIGGAIAAISWIGMMRIRPVAEVPDSLGDYPAASSGAAQGLKP